MLQMEERIKDQMSKKLFTGKLRCRLSQNQNSDFSFREVVTKEPGKNHHQSKFSDTGKS